MRLATLLVVVQLVHVCRGLLRQVEQLVDEQTVVLTAELETRRRAEAAIRDLAAKLSVAEDAERQRLAQDIHDTLGQNLSALKITCRPRPSAPARPRAPGLPSRSPKSSISSNRRGP